MEKQAWERSRWRSKLTTRERARHVSYKARGGLVLVARGAEETNNRLLAV
jgi:hypothetical protein